MSTQSRPRTSVVAAKGQDDQEIVVDAKVKAIQVDDLFPPLRGKRTFVQWDAAASLQRFVDSEPVGSISVLLYLPFRRLPSAMGFDS